MAFIPVIIVIIFVIAFTPMPASRRRRVKYKGRIGIANTKARTEKQSMSRHHEDLEKSFTDEQKETFEKFHDCWSECMSLAEAAIFEYAFKLGMQIAIEILTE